MRALSERRWMVGEYGWGQLGRFHRRRKWHQVTVYPRGHCSRHIQPALPLDYFPPRAPSLAFPWNCQPSSPGETSADLQNAAACRDRLPTVCDSYVRNRRVLTGCDLVIGMPDPGCAHEICWKSEESQEQLSEIPPGSLVTKATRLVEIELPRKKRKATRCETYSDLFLLVHTAPALTLAIYNIKWKKMKYHLAIVFELNRA